ncbi:MAG: hypothetical protein JXB03_02600 [Spirochaetales bacterium]|nr:hypothetical protein [Spirochaetales bacterium]
MIIPQTAFTRLNSHVLAPRLWAFLDNAETDELFPVDVYGLAEKWVASPAQTLGLFLQGLDAGIFVLTWADTCPSCKAQIPCGHSFEGDRTCRGCGTVFRPRADEHRYALFSLDPAVYGSEVPDELPRRARIPGVPAVDCLMLPEFRCGPGWGLIPPGSCLEIRSAAVLCFTDPVLRGLFGTVDDTQAFSEGYRVLSGAADRIRAAGGSVFRYSHDSAVALFLDPVSAVRAAVAIHTDLCGSGRRPAAGGCALSVHGGPVLAVNYGEKVGFSGRTLADIVLVHTKLMHPHITISRQVYEEPGARTLFEAGIRGSVKTRVVLKSAGRDLLVYRGK